MTDLSGHPGWKGHYLRVARIYWGYHAGAGVPVPECKTDNESDNNPDHKDNSDPDKQLLFHRYLFSGDGDNDLWGSGAVSGLLKSSRVMGHDNIIFIKFCSCLSTSGTEIIFVGYL